MNANLLVNELWEGKTIRFIHEGGTKYWDIRLIDNPRNTPNISLPAIATRWGAIKAGVPDIDDELVWSNFTTSSHPRISLKEAIGKIKSKVNRGYNYAISSRIPLNLNRTFKVKYHALTIFDVNAAVSSLGDVKKVGGVPVITSPVEAPIKNGVWDIL